MREQFIQNPLLKKAIEFLEDNSINFKLVNQDKRWFQPEIKVEHNPANNFEKIAGIKNGQDDKNRFLLYTFKENVGTLSLQYPMF